MDDGREMAVRSSQLDVAMMLVGVASGLSIDLESDWSWLFAVDNEEVRVLKGQTNASWVTFEVKLPDIQSNLFGELVEQCELGQVI